MSKVIVITGASSGIGEATAKMLAKSGNKIVLAARREENLKQIVSDIEKAGGRAKYLVTDVTKNDEMVSLAKFANDQFGKIDVWMNNAGRMLNQTFAEGKIKDFDLMVDINIKGVIYGIAAALPYMNKQKSGQFINISSVAGLKSRAGNGVYSATKFAVRALSESLREECAPNNIRVTIISPGAIHTELLSNNDAKTVYKQDTIDWFKEYGINVDDVALTIKQAIDLPQEATWNEVVIRPTKQIG